MRDSSPKRPTSLVYIPEGPIASAADGNGPTGGPGGCSQNVSWGPCDKMLDWECGWNLFSSCHISLSYYVQLDGKE